VKQRTRWTTGFLRNVIYDYRHMIGSKEYGTLGLLMLPIGLLANVSGIIVFAILIVKITQGIWNRVSLIAGFPVSYSFLPHHTFNLVFLPISFVMLISAIMLIGAVTTMLIGKHISKTPGNLFAGIIIYLIFYSFIAPLWLIRSMYDLLTNTRRAWR
jgi:hypothetical protein